MEMNRGEYRRYAKQRRIDNRKALDNSYKNETERSLEEQEEEFTVDKTTGKIKSVMETYERGNKYPKEIQEVSTFWSSLYYLKDEKGNNSIQKEILNELSDDGLIENASRNGSYSFSNLKKNYQQYVYDSYYAFKSGKNIKPENESLTMLDVMVEKKLIKTPKQKEEMEALDSKVTCWSCDDHNQKIVSVEHAVPCSKCGELLWTGEGGFEKVRGKFQ